MESLPFESIYVGGQWIQPDTRKTIAVENPATEEVVANVPACGRDDVRRAVESARAAFPEWSATDAATRAETLTSLRDALVKNQEELSELITREMGSPIAFSRRVQVGLPVKALEGYAEALAAATAEERIGHSLVVREAAGVVAAVTPWNYPLHQAVAKIGAALAAGCTMVLKPSELAPLSACFLATLIDGLGLPAGTFNLVQGEGRAAGQALVTDEGADVISFTGSVRVGREVGAAAGQAVKRACLELGGKSATLVLDGADLAAAVRDGVRGALLNAGQTCSARTRLLVPRSRLEDAVDVARSVVAQYVPGDPTDPDCALGPLISAAQADNVRERLYRAADRGARRVAGPDPGQVPTVGHYVAPSVWTDLAPSAPLAREEIFGPVLVVLPFEDEDEAVSIANGTPYGLAATVWAGDTEHAAAVGRRLRAGQVDLNAAKFNPAAPFGGYGLSGVGRELGRHGIQEFQEVKSLQFPA
ncbi:MULTISPECIES: aldehyde dehydrogenase family protein [unclassified Streptomyces]|uniref:aldehyde dehydrogenase family protein n=1 Tax=unclassified Streptomyces TaxID=2593676 RepID=UPI0033F66624